MLMRAQRGYLSNMNPRVRLAVRILVPLTAAFLAIVLEPFLTALAVSRPGVLPVAMVTLLGLLLLPRARRLLLVTLCYGVALLAFRDAFRVVPPPPLIDYDITEDLFPILRPLVWGMVAILAGTAGTLEAIEPGRVTARRCYFAAAALYFSGNGLLGLLRTVNWEALALLATGIGAAFGVLYAHRIVAAEKETEAEDDDIRALAELPAKRAALIAAREWQDAPEKLPNAR